jgi:hypothetical protein
MFLCKVCLKIRVLGSNESLAYRFVKPAYLQVDLCVKCPLLLSSFSQNCNVSAYLLKLNFIGSPFSDSCKLAC